MSPLPTIFYRLRLVLDADAVDTDADCDDDDDDDNVADILRENVTKSCPESPN